MNASLSGRQIRTMQATLITKILALSALLLAASSVNAQSSTLSELPTDAQDTISRVCLPVQFREGATAYRNCVQAEVQLYRSGNTTDLGKLSFDDKYAVQQFCAKDGGQSPALYQRCVSTQITALNAITEPEFEKVSEDELYVVQQSCFDAQSNSGAAEYRNCLNAEISSLLSIPSADTSQLDSLKKNALQLRCSSQSSNAVQYRQCVTDEFESIVGTTPEILPAGSAVASTSVATATPEVAEPADTVAEVVQETVEAPVVEAPVISDASSAIETDAVENDVQTANVPASQPVYIENVASQESAGENTLRDATTNELANTLAQNTSSDAQSNSTPADARVISKPNLVETLELQERAKAQGIELEPTTDSDVAAATGTANSQTGEILAKLSAMGQSALDKLASAGSTGWLIIAGLLALPALLLGMFSVSRRMGRSNAHHIPDNASALADRIEPGMRTRRIRQEREAAELFGDGLPGDFNDNVEELEDKYSARIDDEPVPAHDEATRLVSKPAPSTEQDLAQQERVRQAQAQQAQIEQEQMEQEQLRMQQEEHANAQASQQAPSVAAQHASHQENAPYQASLNPDELSWQSAFGGWLMQLPEQDRMESCIEFLIYWVAYGDKRYPRELRSQLFTATELSSHDQIKRWVLKQDVLAFADVVTWLSRNASPRQLDQTIGLIMALLVTENNITPVQNTLLRFMSDAFNTGIERLQLQFKRGFGHELPPMPRPDKQAWWDRQHEYSHTLWDARTLACKTEDEQMMARLGLDANFDEAQVIQAFRRAARRCHPDRFTELGDRERALAEQQHIKFEQARDRLLGVSV